MKHQSHSSHIANIFSSTTWWSANRSEIKRCQKKFREQQELLANHSLRRFRRICSDMSHMVSSKTIVSLQTFTNHVQELFCHTWNPQHKSTGLSGWPRVPSENGNALMDAALDNHQRNNDWRNWMQLDKYHNVKDTRQMTIDKWWMIINALQHGLFHFGQNWNVIQQFHVPAIASAMLMPKPRDCAADRSRERFKLYFCWSSMEPLTTKKDNNRLSAFKTFSSLSESCNLQTWGP